MTVLRSKPFCIDKSAAASATNCWWQEVVTSIPQQRWNFGSKQQRDCLKAIHCSGNYTDIAILDNHTDSGKLEESMQTCRAIEVEAGCGRDDGLIEEVTSALNRIGSSIRNQHVTASPDERAEIIADRMSDAQMKNECTANRTTQRYMTDPRTREQDDTTLLQMTEMRRPADQTVRPSQRIDNSSRTDTPMLVSSHRQSQNSPITARMDSVVRLTAESMITAGHVSDERSASSDTECSSTDAYAAGTGSTLSARKRFASENELDYVSTRMFNVHPSVTAATKPNYATNVPHYETIGAKTEVRRKTQPNAVLSSTTEANSRLAEDVRVEENLGITIAQHDSEATKDDAISVRNSAANRDRTTDRKSLFDVYSLTSSTTRTNTKPAIARVIKMLSCHSQDSPSADTVSTDVDYNTPITSENGVNNVKVVEHLVSGTSADNSLAVRKHTDVSAARENQNTVQLSKYSNSGATEQASSISERSRLPSRLNQTTLDVLNDTISSDQRNTASVETDSAVSNTADSLAVKLVRVDHMIRSVPPVAPANIRSTGVATPAVQAQKLASTRDDTVASRLSAGFQTEGRSAPTTEK